MRNKKTTSFYHKPIMKNVNYSRYLHCPEKFLPQNQHVKGYPTSTEVIRYSYNFDYKHSIHLLPSLLFVISLQDGNNIFLITFAKVYCSRTFSSSPEKQITRSCISLFPSSFPLNQRQTKDQNVLVNTQ